MVKKIIGNLFSISLVLAAINFSSIATAATYQDENNTLHVYVTNNTPNPLFVIDIVNRKQGINFSVTPKTANPGEIFDVKVEKFSFADIQGLVIFANSNYDEAPLFILDQEQIHNGQPVFNINSEKFRSTLVSKTRNKNVGPRYLTYVEAKLEIENK